MARNLVTAVDEFQVNLLDPLPRSSAPLENGILGFQIFPSVALLANGNFVVAYQNDAGGKGDQDILAVEFTAAGKVAHTPFRVDFDAGDQGRPDVAPRNDGGYAVVWEEDSDDSIHLVVVTDGTLPNPPERTINKVTDVLLDPSIATFANGNYIVTYTREAAASDDVWFAIVDPNGATFPTGNTGLVTTLAVDEHQAKVATSGNLAAVAFVTGSEFSSDIALSIVSSSGVSVDFEVVADFAASAFIPDVAALSDGRFLIVWTQAGTTFDLMGRIYDPDTGDFSGAAFTVANGPNDQEFARMTALPDGGFVATWMDVPKSGEQTVQARRFDANGAPAGDKFLLSDTPGFFATLAADKSGRVFAAWMTAANKHTTDPDIGIDGKVLGTATETVNGTPDDDTITTYGLSEPINGLGGKDRIDARGGNDLVSGGEGKDTLTGGLGTDGFLFDVKLKGKNVDHITDLTPGVDGLVLDHGIFKKLKVGDLKNSAFFAGNKVDEGKDDKDLIVYDKKSGKVFYDADGPGGQHAKLFAILDGSPNDLKAGDILVVA